MNIILIIKNWLNKPYFIIESKRAKLIIAFSISLIIFFNLNYLRPHGVGRLQNNLLHFSLGYCLIIFSTLCVYFFVAMRFFSKFFNNEKWTIGKEIISIFFVLVFIAIFGWAYTNEVQIGGKNPDKFTLLAFFKYTFSGIVPITMYVFLSELLLGKFRKDTSKKIMLELGKKDNVEALEKNDTDVKIFATNKKDFIQFNINDLVYVSSQGNYVSFFLRKNNSLKEKVLRGKLLTVQEDLKKFNFIIRCHKSYIVNTAMVKELSGNARGYFLHFDESLDLEIPVSRKFSRNELETLIYV